MKDEYENSNELNKFRKYKALEDVAEEKAAKKAGAAYDKAMPEADTTFGKLKQKATDLKQKATDVEKKVQSSIKDFTETPAGKVLKYADPIMGPARAAMDAVGVAKDMYRDKKNREPLDSVPGQEYKKGGKVSASSRADGCATKGKTRGKFV